MEKQKIIQYIKDKYGDIFDVDDASGNLTFKATKDNLAFEMICR